MSAFNPGTTYSLAATASTQRIQLWAAPIGVIAANQIMVVNVVGNPFIWINTGLVSVTAVITAVPGNGPAWPIPPGTVQIFDVNINDNYLAYICATGTGTLYVTVGSGV